MQSDGPDALELDVLPTWFDKRASPMLRAFRQDSRNLLEEIDRTVSNIRAAAQRLASTTYSDPESKSQPQHGSRLTERISSSFDKIQLPEVLSYENVQGVYRKLVQALEGSTDAGRIVVPRLNSSFKPKIIELDSEFKRLQGLLFKLAQVLRSNRSAAEQIEAVRRNVQRAADNEERVRQVRAEMQRVEEQIGRLKVQLLEMDSRVKKVRGEGWFKELEKVRTEISDIEEKLSKIRSQLNRPFRKLQKLVGDGEVSLRPESLVALRSFVDDPAYKHLDGTDLTHFSLLLHDVGRLLEDDKIVLEKRKKRKALDAIRVAQDGFLKQIREEYEHLRQRERQLMSTSEAGGLAHDSLKLEVASEMIEAQIGELEQSREQLQMKVTQLQAGLKELSHEIEDSIRSLLGVEVAILATR